MSKHSTRRRVRKIRRTRRVRRGGFSMNPFAKKVNQTIPATNVATVTPATTPMTMKNRMSGALSRITPSQAKLNALRVARNKTLQGAKNAATLAKYGAVGVGKGAWSAAKGVGSMAKNVVTSPIYIASQLAQGSF